MYFGFAGLMGVGPSGQASLIKARALAARALLGLAADAGIRHTLAKLQVTTNP